MDFSVFFKPSFDVTKINKQTINRVDRNGYTLLNYAIYYNDLKAACEIIKAGAKIDVCKSKYNNKMSIIQKWLSLKTPTIKSILYLIFEDWDEACSAIHFFELYNILINSYNEHDTSIIEKALSKDNINWNFKTPSNNHIVCYIQFKAQFDLCKKYGMVYAEKDVIKGINNFDDRMIITLIHDGFNAHKLLRKIHEDDSRCITILVQHRMYIRNLKDLLESLHPKVATDLHNETLEFL
jgi:hypothetical protein